MVRTDVSFAPTKAFADAFPNEVEAQSAKFAKPSWAAKFPQMEEEPEPLADCLREEQLDKAVAILFVGGVFLAGFMVARYYYAS